MASSPQPSQLDGSRRSRASVSDPTGLITDSTARSESTSPAGAASRNHRNNDGQLSLNKRGGEGRGVQWDICVDDGVALQQSELMRRDTESWVEIASQPSSSSLSSIGDEIVTTGLRVGNQSYPPQRRRLQHHYHQSVQQQMPQSHLVNHSAAQAGTSSQDEYDETESEEDHLMTSSIENMDTRPVPGGLLQRSQTAIGPGADSSDSEDDDGTALGTTHSFRPQPHAFSRPHAHLSHRSHSTNSAIPPHHPHGRPSPTSYRPHHRARNDFRSPSYQADNDAALRASLTTLLSCAAAAKSLPGRTAHTTEPSSGEPVLGAGLGPSTQPMELRLVPESDLGALRPTGGEPSAPKSAPRTRQPTTRTSSNSSAQSVPASNSSKEDKAKRTASTGQSKSQRATKKKRTSTTGIDDNTVTWISPTTLTWVLGTGVVLLVSVVGFGAGFVVGREVGRQDILSSTTGSGGAAMSAGMNSSSCGGEVIRSTGSGTLRRWRWGTDMARSVIA